MSTLPPTGSLVEWKRANESALGPGLIFSYEKKITPLLPGVMGAWVHWPGKDDLVWTAVDNLKFLVHTSSC